MSALLIGIGVGPGDPELVTLRALRALREADRVFAPVSDINVEGRAESIVRSVAPEVEVTRVAFVMERDTDARNAAINAAAATIINELDANKQVAFITLGDPNIYSTVTDVVAAVRDARPQVPIGLVPGIMAFQELAARSGTVVVDGNDTLTLVTGLDGTATIDTALSEPTSAVVVYKGGHLLPSLAKRLEAAGRLDGTVVGELLGLEGERISAIGDRSDGTASYLATVIVPPVRAERSGRIAKDRVAKKQEGQTS
ncbi:MAG: precorrin-2 C(20)-methyltransferase [Acidimicrobiales bacterium]